MKRYLVSVFVLVFGITIILGSLYKTEYNINKNYKNEIENYKNEIENYRNKITQLNLSMDELTYFYKEKEATYCNPIHKQDYIKLTSPFGIRKNPLKESMGGSNTNEHRGVDLTGRQTENIKGTWMARVISISGGIVKSHYLPKGLHFGILYKGHPDFDGYIIIKHFDGRESRYGHLGETYIHEGDIVEEGQTIGRISKYTNGKSTGPHLHFELLDKEEKHLQPLKYIKYW